MISHCNKHPDIRQKLLKWMLLAIIITKWEKKKSIKHIQVAERESFSLKNKEEKIVRWHYKASIQIHVKNKTQKKYLVTTVVQTIYLKI